MIFALKDDQRFAVGLQISPLRIGARDMNEQRPEFAALGIEQKWNGVGKQPLRPACDKQAERTRADERMHRGAIGLAMERGFVHAIVPADYSAAIPCPPKRFSI